MGVPELSATWPGENRSPARPAVVTGAFDLLHVGHVRFLAQVRERGRPLVVGVEDDERVRAWKGPTRPLNTATERAELLAALRVVDAVFIVSGPPELTGWQDYVALLRPLGPAALAWTENDPYRESRLRGARELGADAWELPLTRHRSTSALLAAADEL